MISSAQNLPSKPAMPPAAMPAPATPATGPSFAQFLTDQSAPPPSTEGDDAATTSEGVDEGDIATRNTAANRRNGQPRLAAPQRAPEASAKTAAPTDKIDTRPAADVKAATDEDPDADTPELAEFTQLIGLTPAPTLPTPAPVTTDAAASALPANADDAARERTDGRRLALGDTGRSVETADSSRPAVDTRADSKPAPRAAPQVASTESLQKAAETPVSATAARQEATAPSFANMLAQSLPAPVVRADAQPAPVPQAAVQAPLNSPAFAPEMGTRVSLMAVDGVQRAELQLNPAEMGPVTVEIVVDGSQAQVSFQAAQAETRQVLEQCLPDLAAALQGQGLTLSGGGVFQQSARDNGHGDGQPGNANASGDGRGTPGGQVGEPAASSAPVRRSVGLLDTFA
ncbi:flagellar hook-length control protein FliK [Roseateles asaccharophilus]|uniref:Flagellar hook-length control protein FliK n=1 Tax=Roseateles asaccharophilus TaxID=582607 RepID=A0ABU2ACP0_9BURK|nr:flagellar hook-length control protein FliK [Roseateles asaccharophilus]MDR7334969.1 flagellar hook-length control protein FliK [Roseateles asaccharophilus]